MRLIPFPEDHHHRAVILLRPVGERHGDPTEYRPKLKRQAKFAIRKPTGMADRLEGTVCCLARGWED
jgi:hypothetical protein